MDYRQRYRLIVCGRLFGDQLITVVIHTPETIAMAAPAFLARLLGSMKPA